MYSYYILTVTLYFQSSNASDPTYSRYIERMIDRFTDIKTSAEAHAFEGETFYDHLNATTLILNVRSENGGGNVKGKHK